MKDTNNYSGLVFTPLEASNAAENYIEELRKNDGDGMPLYLPKLEYNEATNKGFLPVKRGELITVLGRPGSGKTGFMFHWARRRAKELQQQAEQERQHFSGVATENQFNPDTYLQQVPRVSPWVDQNMQSQTAPLKSGTTSTGVPWSMQ